MDILLTFLPSNVITFLLAGFLYIAILLFFFSAKRSQYIIFALMVWLPLENLFLRYTDINYYVYVKYFPEVLFYGLFLVAWLKYIWTHKRLLPANPLNKWLAGFLAVSVISLLLNWYSSAIWVLGLRQLFRFTLVMFVVQMENYDKKTVKQFVLLALFMFLLEAGAGILQYGARGSLDKYLVGGPAVSLGELQLSYGVDQFWIPGSRALGTMGRYDLLGSFMALGFLLFFPFVYALPKSIKKNWLLVILALGALALFLTFSRASWLAVAGGLFAVAAMSVGHRKILKTLMVGGTAAIIVLAAFAFLRGNVFKITDNPNQNVFERVFEAVSPYAWRESYYGYGRIFFIINTPRVVVANSPLFGVGLGNYGGGAAAALQNTLVYDRLHLPFGISNVYGQIDNSWFSIWGESGTIGLLCFLGMFIMLLRLALKKIETGDEFDSALGKGVFGAAIGLIIMGFFGPYLEFRALLFYFWLFAGCLML